MDQLFAVVGDRRDAELVRCYVEHDGRSLFLDQRIRLRQEPGLWHRRQCRGRWRDRGGLRDQLEGRVDDIRQCVGYGYCIDRIYVGNDAVCIQNAATGRERTAA